MIPLQTSVNSFQVASFVVSGLALVVSLVVAVRTDRRAGRAERNVREAAAGSLWSDAIEATLRVLTDPSREDTDDRFLTLGVRYTALVDGLQDWKGLDKWLSAETQLASALRYQAREARKTGPTTGDVERAFSRYADWVQATSQNLRHFRNVGHKEQELGQLTERASQSTSAIRERYGLPAPDADSNIAPL